MSRHRFEPIMPSPPTDPVDHATEISAQHDKSQPWVETIWFVGFCVILAPLLFLIFVVALIMTIRDVLVAASLLRRSHPSTILRCPGVRLTRWSEFVFSKKAFRQVFGPVLADMQFEYFEALAERALWKARWVQVRGYCAFWHAVLLYGVTSLARTVIAVARLVK